jgi:hypothetical protein
MNKKSRLQVCAMRPETYFRAPLIWAGKLNVICYGTFGQDTCRTPANPAAGALPPLAHSPKPHWPAFLKPFPPGVEGILRQPLLFAELLHGHSAALLRSDSFGPLACFGVGRLRVDQGVAHDTTMRHPPVLRKSGSRGAHYKSVFHKFQVSFTLK